MAQPRGGFCEDAEAGCGAAVRASAAVNSMVKLRNGLVMDACYSERLS
ncbi:hypothetical protein GCM10023096_24070 [Nonomuraea ferruginea]